MSGIFKHSLQKYLERLNNLESHLLCIQDECGLFEGYEDIDLHLYPHSIIPMENNVVFRAKYEHIKHKNDRNYILLFKGQENHKKVLDFVRRSENKKVHSITIQDVMNQVEPGLNWNEYINEFDKEDIQRNFSDIIDYSKRLKKSQLSKKDILKILVSALTGVDGTNVADEGDCFLFYKALIDLYQSPDNIKANSNLKGLIVNLFREYGSVTVDVIKKDTFDQLEKVVWISKVLQRYGRLNKINLQLVLKSEYNNELVPDLGKLIELADLIGKKNQSYFYKKIDWAEKIVSNSGIEFSNINNPHVEIREGNVNFITILKAMKDLLAGYNLEGAKRVYKYKNSDLLELKNLLEETVQYRSTNINNLLSLFNKILSLLDKISKAETGIEQVIEEEDYRKWQTLYKTTLFDMQYRLSEIWQLDNHALIDKSRYQKISVRVNKVLNSYRAVFAKFLEKNYPKWNQGQVGSSRPILNNDIGDIIKKEDGKIFVLVFDGMRYDAWHYIVRPYFEKAFKNRNIEVGNSFSLLPSITSISRDAIYSSIINQHREEVAFLTKSESVKNQKEIQEVILKDKKYNIFVFNMFDKDGHKATEDFYLFYDKQRKVFEGTISNLLNQIPDEDDIVVASDHGLMRVDQYESLREVDGIKECKYRYLRAEQGVSLGNCIELTDGDNLDCGEKLLLTYDNKGYFKGGGEKHFYSHGGASIEEVIVPLIVARSKSPKPAIPQIKKTDSVVLKNGLRLDISFRPTKKEKIILETLYSLKNSFVSTSDIEQKLVNELGSAGLLDSKIKRLVKKLKKDKLDIIEVQSVGDVIMYKFKESGLREEI
ncbi:PglZ domain-containing protein [Proteinivorax hydrogeniformans]|uniref:PglZ domain-containing protein n=1 Tax=Proteinivorax hydrogeniformans TaxID=1826727 RepID=A0AAU8HQT2_9FIRM